MTFGPKYQAATLRGYVELQRRLHAMSGPGSLAVMQLLQQQAIREQKRLLYTEAITRKTGHTGQLIKPAGVSATNARIVATGLAVFADTGTKPHIITPRVKSILRWASSSSKGFRATGKPSSAKGNSIGYIWAHLVHHPGTKAHPYLLKGAKLAAEGGGLVAAIVQKWNDAA